VRDLQERRAVRPALSRRPLVVVATLVAVSVIAVDQVTKSLAVAHLEDREPLHVLWTLQLALAFNSGVAFSLGSGSGLVVVPVALAVVGVVVMIGRTMEGRLSGLCLGLIVGGALGNIIDRLLRSHGGAVVDFIDFQWWPVFNVADAAIVSGGIGLGLLALRRA